MLVRYGNKALEQDFHANRGTDVGQRAADSARPEPQQLSGNYGRFEASSSESDSLLTPLRLLQRCQLIFAGTKTGWELIINLLSL